MTFLHLFIVLPCVSMCLPIFKKVSEIGKHSRLIIFGNEDGIPLQFPHALAQLPFDMPYVDCQNPSSDRCRGEQWFQRLDARINSPSPGSASAPDPYLPRRSEADALFFRASCGTNGLAIDSNQRLVLASCLQKQPARFVSVATPNLPLRKKGGQDMADLLGIQQC